MAQRYVNNFELLSPAGDFESLKAAVCGGADAVYLGLKDYNARSKAGNFSLSELRLALLYCHERNARVYVTMNTVLKDREIGKASDLASEVIEAGADGIILQDLALLTEIKKKHPDFPVHASTQLGVHNSFGAAAAERLGFDRVVLSREVSGSEIKAMRERTGIELEYFIHGAHCISFSGNCYFSSLVSGYSGNRGKCLQLCRKRYTLEGENRKKSGYMLSAKDICQVNNLKKLSELGITCGKIEGRLRSREYAAVTASVYRKAVEGRNGEKDIERLKTVFNRGDFSEAYISGGKPDIVFPDVQNSTGRKVGRIVSAGGRTRPEFYGGFEPLEGDGFKILSGGKEAAGGEWKNGKLVLSGRFSGSGDICLTKSTKIERETDALIQTGENIKAEGYMPPFSKNKNFPGNITENGYFVKENTKAVIINEENDINSALGADIVFLAPVTGDVERIKGICLKIKAKGKDVLFWSPVIAYEKDLEFIRILVGLDIFSGYVVNNIYGLELFKNYPCILGPGMNILSSYLKCPKIMSVESAENPDNDLMFVFGRLTLMNLTHCVRRELGFKCDGCRNGKGFTLTDEQKNRMPLRRTKMSGCSWELLNSKVLNLGQRLSKMNNRLLIDMRGSDAFRAEMCLKDPYAFPFNEKTDTAGRFGKGVK